MKNANTLSNRMVQVKNGVIGPREPRQKSVTAKIAGDYPGAAGAYLDVCELYGPKLEGPPLCDELMALVQHMFTEEEACVVRHLLPFSMLTAENVAETEKRPTEEVRKILDCLADEKHIIMSFGPKGSKAYMVLPIIPGAFELVLVRKSLDTLTDWHRRFAELFEALFETGFMVENVGKRPPVIRYLPVNSVISTHPMALPSDMLEEVIDPYKVFAVGLCQCRMTEEIVGRGCGRPMDNCTGMGDMAEMAIQAGQMRRVEKMELLEIKREAEATGLVNWAMTQDLIPGSSTMCSCCGCCCHGMRILSEFNMPGEIAPPHFMPKINPEKCDYCGKCAKACPMAAVTIDTKGKSREFQTVRCVGCGQCFVACDKNQAVVLEPVPGYEPPIL